MSSNIEVKLDVLNQKASPALYAAPLADRPAASFTGRLFVDSDNPSTGLYRDTGSSWIQIADAGAGTTGTLQQVTTNGNTSNVGISVTANGIGIGTTIPATNRLDIHAASGIQATFNGTGTTNSALQLQSAGVGKWNIRNNYNSGANDFGIFDVLNNYDIVKITNSGVVNITSTVSSVSPTTGALVVAGGIGYSGVLNGGTAAFSGNNFNYFNRNDSGVVLKISSQTAFTQMDFVSVGTTYANIYTNSANGSLSFYTGVLNMVLKSNGVINMPNLPTSSAGLVSGDIYSNLGILTRVP